MLPAPIRGQGGRVASPILSLSVPQIFAATAGFGATLLEPPLGRAWPGKMPPCPPQQGRARAPLLSGPLGGEHGPPGDMDLAWQEILSIAELQVSGTARTQGADAHCPPLHLAGLLAGPGS